MGHVFTRNGLKPDQQKVDAILKLPEPEDASAVGRFLGLVNYLSKFLPGLAAATEPLRQLTQKEAQWIWTDRC